MQGEIIVRKAATQTLTIDSIGVVSSALNARTRGVRVVATVAAWLDTDSTTDSNAIYLPAGVPLFLYHGPNVISGGNAYVSVIRVSSGGTLNVLEFE